VSQEAAVVDAEVEAKVSYTPQLGAIVNYQSLMLTNHPAVVAKVWPDNSADLFLIRPAFEGTMFLKQVPSSTTSGAGSFSPSTATGANVSVNGVQVG